MRGLGKRLLSGRIEVGQDIGVQVFAADGALIDSIAPGSMTVTDWGIVYERWVGLELEKEGWEVDYRGLSLGFYDGGVDLVAFREGNTRYLQCKFKSNSMGNQRIQNVLYAADRYLNDQPLSRGDTFELVVPSIAKAFPTKPRKNKQTKPNLAEQRFKAANNRITVKITEIPMPLGHLHDRPEPALLPIA